MAAALSPRAPPSSNMIDVQADLWLYQLRKEHATLYDMFSKREEDIKKLMKENMEHKTTIKNLIEETRLKEKLRLETLGQLEGLRTQFEKHEAALTAFEHEIQALGKKSSPAQATLSPMTKEQTTRRILFPSVMPIINPSELVIPAFKNTRMKHALPLANTDTVPTQLIATNQPQSLIDGQEILSQETPSKRPTEYIQIPDNSDVNPTPVANQFKQTLRQEGRSLQEFIGDADRMAKNAARKKQPFIIQQFLMGLDDRNLKHKIMTLLAKKDSQKFHKKSNGKHNIAFSWMEVRALISDICVNSSMLGNEEQTTT